MNKNQKNVAEFSKEYNTKLSVENRILDILSELGEVAKEILKISDYGKSEVIPNTALKMELGDVYYSLLELANSLNIDMDESLELALFKYRERLRNGNMGS